MIAGSQWDGEINVDNEIESGSSFSATQRRIKSAAPSTWLGRSRAKVAPAPLSDVDDDDDENKDTQSLSSSISKSVADS